MCRMLNQIIMISCFSSVSHAPAQEPVWYSFPRWSVGTSFIFRGAIFSYKKLAIDRKSFLVESENH